MSATVDEISFDDLLTISDKYKDISADKKPEKPSGQSAHVVYKTAEAKKTPIYKVTKYDAKDVLHTFTKITDSNLKELSEHDFLSFLRLALNVRDPLDRNVPLCVGVPYTQSELCDDYETAVPSMTSKVSFSRVAEMLKSNTIPIPSSAENMEVTPGAEPEDDQVVAMCFIAAWMTRFAVKSPGDKLPLQLVALQGTYLKMYNQSSSVFENFRPTKEYLTSLQNCFQSFPRVRHTLAVHVGYAETKYRTEPKQFNLLRYCFFQHLEFMGMHAYTSAVKIINKISQPVPRILTWLRMNGIEDAIDEVGHILKNHDNGMISGGERGERLWKYARMINDGYFNKMQTSYNPELIATLSWIEIRLGLSLAEGYNSPLNIQAIQGNETLTNEGRAKADAFIEAKNAVAARQAGASIIDRIYAQRHGTLKFSGGPAPKRPMEKPAEEPAKITKKAKFVIPSAMDLDI